jgi:hypothetical protein
MKKILFSLCALAAIAACTKSEVQYEPSGEISFAPVAKTLTKSVAGYYYGENDKYKPTNGEVGKFDGVFPTDIDLYVFANAVDETSSTEYFKNALFEWKEGGKLDSFDPDGSNPAIPTTGAYAGTPTRYWPNVKTLVFAGYSNACNVSTLTTKPSMDFAKNELTITGYTQDNKTYTAEGANDLMWFPCDGTDYSKQANEIVAQMKHACSWITINVAVDENMGSMKCKLNQLDVLQLIHEGKVTCGEKEVKWEFAATPTQTDENYYTNTDGETLSQRATKYETTPNNFIVIPQKPTKLLVEYTYTSDGYNTDDNSDDLTLNEAKDVSLALADNTNWQAGVHYIYNVTITATEILIDPVVVAWTDQTVTPETTI